MRQVGFLADGSSLLGPQQVGSGADSSLATVATSGIASHRLLLWHAGRMGAKRGGQELRELARPFLSSTSFDRSMAALSPSTPPRAPTPDVPQRPASLSPPLHPSDSTLVCLPHDVLQLIIDQVASGSPHYSTSTLKTLCLVSFDFLGAASKHLYRDVVVRPTHVSLFVKKLVRPALRLILLPCPSLTSA